MQAKHRQQLLGLREELESSGSFDAPVGDAFPASEGFVEYDREDFIGPAIDASILHRLTRLQKAVLYRTLLPYDQRILGEQLPQGERGELESYRVGTKHNPRTTPLPPPMVERAIDRPHWNITGFGQSSDWNTTAVEINTESQPNRTLSDSIEKRAAVGDDFMWTVPMITTQFAAVGDQDLSRLYLHLRYVDKADSGIGDGVVTKAALVASYAQYGLGKHVVRKVLGKAKARMLTIKGDSVYYWRPSRIIKVNGFGTSAYTFLRDSKQPVMKCLGAMKDHRAVMLESFYSGRTTKVQRRLLSREKIQARMGIAPTTQQRYGREMGDLMVTPNLGVLHKIEKGETTHWAQAYPSHKLMQRSFKFRDHNNVMGEGLGAEFIVAQLPNIYKSTIKPERIGYRRSARLFESLPPACKKLEEEKSSVGTRTLNDRPAFFGHDTLNGDDNNMEMSWVVPNRDAIQPRAGLLYIT